MGAFVAAPQAAAQAGVRHLPTFSQESDHLKLEGSQLTHRKLSTKLGSEESGFQGQRRSEQARKEVAAFHCGEEL